MGYWIVTDNQVSNGDKPKQFIVNAKKEAQALSAIVKPRYSVVKAEDKDLIELSKAGVEVIEAQ